MGWMRKLTASTVGAVAAMIALEVAPVYAVVSGINTGVNEFPHMAGLVDKNSQSVFCGGTLISDKYVLTAASCLAARKVSDVVILVGDHDYKAETDTPYASLYAVGRVVSHPNFNSTSRENDIALIELTTSVQINKGVSPALLASSQSALENAEVELLGWGATAFGGPTSTTLKKVKTKIISNTACKPHYGNAINDTKLCNYSPNTGSCTFDNGGPVNYKDGTKTYVVGVISYSKGCGSQFPDVNTRVTSYLPWITSITGPLAK